MLWPRMCKDLHPHHLRASIPWSLSTGATLHINDPSPTYYLYASQRLMTNLYHQTIPTMDVCMPAMWETVDKRN